MGIANIGLLKQQHGAFAQALRGELRLAMQEGGQWGKQWSHDHPNYKTRTGELRNATSFRLAMGMGGGKGTLSNAMPYAAPIDVGAKPHTIVPRTAKVLRFFWEKLGRWVSLRKVSHPGNKPYHFLKSATQRAGGRFYLIMRERMAALAKRF